MDASQVIALIVTLLLLAILLIRRIGARHLNSKDTQDRRLKILYMLGLLIALLFAIGAVIWQTRLI